ncbi:TPA: helix-turn-helix domain-containing protein [Clostridium perfringens]|nr:helix-turn-helix transcriptional regulator [Clostridium perfringens]EIF5084145.1 helix-turn-helix transcriptional regulator [Clostridium perfringens]
MSKLINNAGNLIRSKRKEKGYSTQELAKLLNVSPGLINNIIFLLNLFSYFILLYN